MRPDYCPVAKEPCQAMCNPKCRLRKLPTDRELAAAYTNAQSQERNALPRSDKRRAGELLILINQHQAEARKIRPQLVHLRHEAERKSRHTLWFRAVSELFGKDAPERCIQWMREERRRLKESQT